MIEKKGAIPSEVVEKSATLHTASFTPHPQGSGLSEEKQIEEIRNIIETDCDFVCEKCEFDEKEHCFIHYCSTAIYNAGYRKQSEGEWIKDEKSKFEHRYNCPVCNYRLLGIPTNYCPNCGAKMKGGE